MRRRVGHVLVTCTLATFGGGCTATFQVFNSMQNCCDCRARVIHYPGPTIHKCFHDCPIMESSSFHITFIIY